MKDSLLTSDEKPPMERHPTQWNDTQRRRQRQGAWKVFAPGAYFFGSIFNQAERYPPVFLMYDKSVRTNGHVLLLVL